MLAQRLPSVKRAIGKRLVCKPLVAVTMCCLDSEHKTVLETAHCSCASVSWHYVVRIRKPQHVFGLADFTAAASHLIIPLPAVQAACLDDVLVVRLCCGGLVHVLETPITFSISAGHNTTGEKRWTCAIGSLDDPAAAAAAAAASATSARSGSAHCTCHSGSAARVRASTY
jgi:hypothetical protein